MVEPAALKSRRRSSAHRDCVVHREGSPWTTTLCSASEDADEETIRSALRALARRSIPMSALARHLLNSNGRVKRTKPSSIPSAGASMTADFARTRSPSRRRGSGRIEAVCRTAVGSAPRFLRWFRRPGDVKRVVVVRRDRRGVLRISPRPLVCAISLALRRLGHLHTSVLPISSTVDRALGLRFNEH